MNRRDFLKHGVLAGAAAGAGGCATFNLQPPSNLFSIGAMRDYLANLDGAMRQLFSRPLPAIFEGEVRDERVEALARKGLGALTLSGALHELSPEDQAHPGMQARIMNNAGLFDEAALGMNERLLAASPTERSDVARALRDDPELGMRVVGVLDAEATAVGVPPARRMKLRAVGLHASARLRQSPSMLIDEYAAKIDRVTTRQGSLEAFERQLAAQMGHDAFKAHKDRLLGADARWRAVLAREGNPGGNPSGLLNDEELRPVGGGPRWPDEAALGHDSASYRKHARAMFSTSGVLFGLGALAGGIGLAIGFSTRDWIAAAFAFTPAGLLVLGGIIFLIVGLALNARAS